MKRRLAITLVTVLSLLVISIPLLLSALLFILATEKGTEFTWKQAQAYLPQTVSVHSLEGRLAGPLAIKGLQVTSTTFHLEIDSIKLEWLPTRLFRRIFDIDSLAVEGVRYTQLEPPTPPSPQEAATPINLPEAIVLLLNLRLGHVGLNSFEFPSLPDGDPFVIDLANFAATADTTGVNISSLNIKAPLFAVEGQGNLATQEDYNLQGELHWQVPVPDYPTLKGHTLLDGSLRQLTLHQRIEKPYDLQAEVLLKNPVDNLSFEAALKVNELRLQPLNENLPPVAVQVDGTSKGTLTDIGFNLSGWVEEPDLGKVNYTTDGRFKSQTISINQLKITVPEHIAQLTAAGQMALTSQQQLSLTAHWQQLQWPLAGSPLITSPNGIIRLTGSPENLHAALDIEVDDTGRIKGEAGSENKRIDLALVWHNLQWPLKHAQIISPKGHVAVAGKIEDYSLIISAKVLVPDQTDGEFQIEGHGSQDSLDLSRVDIHALEGTLKGKAKVSWKPELNGAIELDGNGLNPGVLLQEWPGKLAVSLRAMGGVTNQHPSLQLPQLKVLDQLRGYDLSLDGAGDYEKDLIILKRLALSSGSTQLNTSGTIGDKIDVNWMVQSADLGTLLPKAQGRLDGRGSLAGDVKSPQITANLTAEDLSYSAYSLKALGLKADVDLTGEKQSDFSLSLQEGNAAGIQLRKIDLNGQGNFNAHTITLAADTSHGQADINLKGILYNPWQQNIAWNFELNQLKLKYQDLDEWVLQSPSNGHITATETQLGQSCWQSGEALLCLKGEQSSEMLQANFKLTDLPFCYLAPYLAPDITIQGGLSGKGSLHKTGSKSKESSFTVDLNTSKIRLLSGGSEYEELQKDALIVEFLPGDIHLKMEQDEIQATMKLPLSETDGLNLQAAVTPGAGSLMERPLKGQITTEVQNLAFIADLIPEVQKLCGRLKGDIALTGSLLSPVLKGSMDLFEGAASLERPGLNIKGIRVDLSGGGDGGIRLTAHATSEAGVLNIDGTADLRENSTKADIRVTGENFRIIDTVEIQADVSPDLTIALRDKRVDVKGEILLPRADIKLKTLPESAVKVSDDQVIIMAGDQEKPERAARQEIYTRVRINLGDDVNFNGFGLNARIKGSLLTVDKPGEQTTGSGELSIVDGEYRAYGQGLVIDRGRILFPGGPISQPGVDVRAVRRPAKDILVGVQVRGSLKQPEFTIFSNPTMTQGNQLSYIVLGRPLAGTSGGEGSALSRAALALGLKGGNALASKIGDKLGLDQFGVDSGEAGSASRPEQGSFVIGKYLSPKLYVSYGLGLFNPISTLRLQYAINSRWQLVTESSSAASGGDLIYTIETGK